MAMLLRVDAPAVAMRAGSAPRLAAFATAHD